MEDWFNKIGDDKSDDSVKRVGRIYQDDNTFEGADFLGDFTQNTQFDRSSYRSNDEFDFSDTGRYSYQNSTATAENNDYFSHDDSFDTAELDFSSIRSQIEAKEAEGSYTYDENEIDGDIESSSKKMSKLSRLSKGKKIAISIVAILTVVAIIFGSYVLKMFAKVNYLPETHKNNEYISSNELISDKNVINILLIGTDERASQSNYRSDTMMLVSIDKKNKKIKLSSFLRDTWVYIPGKDTSAKLNASCSYGGPQMVIDTLEYHFKVKIDKYVMINFKVFKTIVNDLGGITLTITEAEAANITKEGHFECKAGTRTVKGKTALWYARIRHLDSDFNRTARQRKVIQAVIDKAKESDVSTLMTVLNDVLPEIQTDISKTEMANLGVNALLRYIKYDIEEQQVPAKGTWSNSWVGSQQVLKADIDENAKILKEFIYGE